MAAPPSRAQAGAQSSGGTRTLGAAGRSIYALGDFTVNTALAALTLLYTTYFLTQVAGLRPALAAAVAFLGRTVDAFTDPLMGRLSDAIRVRGERRRPYFLIGAIPFGIAFACLWLQPSVASPLLLFGYYSLVYLGVSVFMTVLSVPYLALIPEMARGYDERTSFNAYRHVGSVLGIVAAVGLRPLAEALGGGGHGYAVAGALFGVVLALPWLFVYRVSFERSDFAARPVHAGFATALATALRHRSFSLLVGLFLCGRIAMDLVGALLVLYMAYWIGRPGDFEIAMLILLAAVVISLPAWLRLARRFDKATVFIIGTLWWLVLQGVLYAATPSWPRWALLGCVAAAGVGYAVVDLMPWAMLGDVIDEADLATGERREGLYNGVFTFLRKIAGALAVLLSMSVLDAIGLVQGAVQSETVRTAIRLLTTMAPMAFLLLAAWIARRYPLTREAHAAILRSLDARPEDGRLKA